MTVHIVTGIFGGFDAPKRPVFQTLNCRWTLVTDNPDIDVPGWNVHLVDGDHRHPRLAAKAPKLQPWRYTDGDGPWIWIDGAFEVMSATFAAEAIAATNGNLIGQWRHPWRDCIYEEARVVHGLRGGKYDGYPALEQADHYRQLGHPVNWGLWATGLIVYTEPLDDLAERWWDEMNRWGYQDQISQPVVLRELGLRPTDLPGGLHRSPWLEWHPHRSSL